MSFFIFFNLMVLTMVITIMSVITIILLKIIFIQIKLVLFHFYIMKKTRKNMMSRILMMVRKNMILNIN